MKFGPVPVGEAADAILAHTHRLPDGVLKKGRRLTDEDVARLRDSGKTDVIVARLSADDVHEDEAARRLAEAVAGDGVRVADATTGRANLHAATAGLVVLDRAAVDGVNLVDESLTLATVAPFEPVDEGTMIATVKVIPFGVSRAAVVAAENAAQNLLRVAPFRPLRVGLVSTTLDGVAESQLAKGAASQRARVARLSGTLVRDTRCEHAQAPLATLLGKLGVDDLDLILVLGASAIIDRDDVVPTAIRSAGGEVVHLGMPTDPGNLALLGNLGGATVLGVPGCARSLARSGFDALLERRFAGLPLDADAIMRMGVGGLLEDVPSRPSPRRSGSSHTRPHVVAVVLAAGRSQRMASRTGERNKLLIDVDGIPMVARVVDSLIASHASEVVVVTGHERERVEQALAGRKLTFIHNPDYAAGMGTSVRTGVGAAEARGADAIVIALGDMPWIRTEHVDALVDGFADGGASICVPVFGTKRGNPVVLGARWFDAMKRLDGDRGARGIIAKHPDDVRAIPMDDGAVLVDVDTPETLASLDQPD